MRKLIYIIVLGSLLAATHAFASGGRVLKITIVEPFMISPLASFPGATRIGPTKCEINPIKGNEYLSGKKGSRGVARPSGPGLIQES